jgi:hypothetical protein
MHARVQSDVDAFDAAAVTAQQERTVEDLLAATARERAALLGVLARLPEALFDRPLHFRGDRKRSPRKVPLDQFLRSRARTMPSTWRTC